MNIKLILFFIFIFIPLSFNNLYSSENNLKINVNDDTYSGTFLSEYEKGYGEVNYKNGDVYIGSFKNNKNITSNSFQLIDYNIMSDRLTFLLAKEIPSGFQYFKRELPKYPSFNKINITASEIMNYASSNIFNSNWINKFNVLSNRNSYSFSSKIYDASWMKFYKNGNGIMRYINGDIYNGMWKNNLKYGYGIMHYHNSDVFIGNWGYRDDENNKNPVFFHNGLMFYKNGNIYEGTYMDKKIIGEGKMIYRNGDVYNGAWQNNNKHGDGFMEYSSGFTFKGSWLNNNISGSGSLTLVNGKKIKKVFRDGIFGIGIYRLTNLYDLYDFIYFWTFRLRGNNIS